jgi:hypothetical protein
VGKYDRVIKVLREKIFFEMGYKKDYIEAVELLTKYNDDNTGVAQCGTD